MSIPIQELFAWLIPPSSHLFPFLFRHWGLEVGGWLEVVGSWGDLVCRLIVRWGVEVEGHISHLSKYTFEPPMPGEGEICIAGSCPIEIDGACSSLHGERG